MTNRELRKVLNDIERKEGMTLQEIAATAGVNRSNLSTFINSTEVKKVGKRMAAKFELAFERYFTRQLYTSWDKVGIKKPPGRVANI
jgi:predicted transcriptional regulator